MSVAHGRVSVASTLNIADRSPTPESWLSDIIDRSLSMAAPDRAPTAHNPHGLARRADTASIDRADAHIAPTSDEDTSDEDRLTSGQLISGRYRLETILGDGTFGDVWSAYDTRRKRDVAIKFTKESIGTQSRQWLRTELTALRRVSLPGVVRFLDDGPIGERWFIVMERVYGQAFPGGGPLSAVTARLLEVLARLHRFGIVHRDLKPANVLVDALGRPTVVDLGIARVEAIDPLGRPCFACTPAFAPPEQSTHGQADARSDLFSVGKMVNWVRRDPLPPALASLVDHLTRQQPTDRPQTAEEALRMLGHDLSADATGLEIAEPAASPTDLMHLFAGPEPFLHRQSRSAAALWARTGGRPAGVKIELASWLRAGLCWLQEGQVIVEPSAIVKLAAGMAVSLEHTDPALPDDAAELAVWIRLAFPHATEERLQLILGWSRARFDDAITALRDAQRLWHLDNGALGMSIVLDPARRWPPNRRRIAHRLLAEVIPDGFTRMRHLAIGAGADIRFDDLIAACRRALIDGRLTEAKEGLTLGLHCARARCDADAELRLLGLIAIEALVHDRPAEREMALAEVLCAQHSSDAIEQLEHLLRGALLASRSEPSRAEEELAEVAPFDDPLLECWRMAARVDAARRRGDEQPLLDSLTDWVGSDPAREAMLLGWQGTAYYHRSRFTEAARCHAAATLGKPTATSRLSSRINEAQSRLEGLDLQGAFEVAEAAAIEAQRQGVARFEALLTWIMRTAGYRMARIDRASVDLVDAAAAVDCESEALFAATEAAIAWRSGGPVIALCERAAARFDELRYTQSADLVRALAMASGAPSTPDQRQELAERAAVGAVHDLGVQTLGLLLRVEPRADWHATATDLAARARPVEQWSARLDVISFCEALDLMPASG